MRIFLLSDIVAVAALAALPPTLLALAALITGLRRGKVLGEVQQSVNGARNELLVEITNLKAEVAELKRVRDLG